MSYAVYQAPQPESEAIPSMELVWQASRPGGEARPASPPRQRRPSDTDTDPQPPARGRGLTLPSQWLKESPSRDASLVSEGGEGPNTSLDDSFGCDSPRAALPPRSQLKQDWQNVDVPVSSIAIVPIPVARGLSELHSILAAFRVTMTLCVLRVRVQAAGEAASPTRRSGSASPTLGRRRRWGFASSVPTIPSSTPGKSLRFDEWLRTDGDARSVGSAKSGSKARARLAEVSEDPLSDHMDQDMLPLFNLLDPEAITANPRNAAKAKAEVFRLVRDERRQRAEAVAAAKAYRSEVDKLTDVSRRVTASRVICERMLKGARDSAVQRACELQQELDALKSSEAALRRQCDDATSQLAGAHTAADKGKRDAEAAIAAAATAATAHAAAIASLTRELEEEKASAAAARAKAVEEGGRADRAEARVKKLEDDDVRLRACVSALEGGLAKSQEDLGSAHAKTHRMHEQISTLTAALEAARADLKAEQANSARMKVCDSFPAVICCVCMCSDSTC